MEEGREGGEIKEVSEAIIHLKMIKDKNMLSLCCGGKEWRGKGGQLFSNP